MGYQPATIDRLSPTNSLAKHQTCPLSAHAEPGLSGVFSLLAAKVAARCNRVCSERTASLSRTRLGSDSWPSGQHQLKNGHIFPLEGGSKWVVVDTHAHITNNPNKFAIVTGQPTHVHNTMVVGMRPPFFKSKTNRARQREIMYTMLCCIAQRLASFLGRASTGRTGVERTGSRIKAPSFPI